MQVAGRLKSRGFSLNALTVGYPRLRGKQSWSASEYIILKLGAHTRLSKCYIAPSIAIKLSIFRLFV
jgi:hypothetical protein